MPKSDKKDSKKKEEPKEEKPQVNPDLSGFNIKINEFGEITSTFDVEKLNNFLDRTVEDKKFRGIDVVKRHADDAKPERLQKPADSEDDPSDHPTYDDGDAR